MPSGVLHAVQPQLVFHEMILVPVGQWRSQTWWHGKAKRELGWGFVKWQRSSGLCLVEGMD